MSAAYNLSNPNTPLPLSAVFPFVQERGHVIALVGAGGKTTLMFSLADLMSSNGMRVSVTTTTHIKKPPFFDSLRNVNSRWSRGKYAVLGRGTGDGKLEALPTDEYSALCDISDAVLVEADGSRRLPAKAPAAHEPQIPSNADIVIAVQGLSAIGKPLASACHRPDIAADILGTEKEHALTSQDLAILLTSERGGRKGVGDRAFYAVLNQCDSAEQRASVSEELRKPDSPLIGKIILLCLQI